MITKEEIKKMIEDMIFKFGISPAKIADKMRISTRTLDRWRTGQTEPKLQDKFYLRQMYRGYAHRLGIKVKK